MKLRTLLFASLLLHGATACRGDRPFAASPLRASFPLFVTIPGTEAGQGQIVRVDLDAEGHPTQEVVLSNLDFPSGIAVGADRQVYFTENRGGFAGRLRHFDPDTAVVSDLVAGLNHPSRLAIDSFGRLYTATDDGVILAGQDGSTQTVLEEAIQPDASSFDEKDNLYLLFGTSVVRFGASGDREDLEGWLDDAGVTAPASLASGSGKRLFILDRGRGLADGSIFVRRDGGETEKLVSGLVNPVSLAMEDLTTPYVAEASPAFRVVRYVPDLSVSQKVADLPGIPHSMAFTPRHGLGDSLVKDL